MSSRNTQLSCCREPESRREAKADSDHSLNSTPLGEIKQARRSKCVSSVVVLMMILFVRGPGDLGFKEMSSPEPGQGQVLVQMKACGICGTDLRLFRRGEKVYPYFGHEFSGIVKSAGEDIEDLKKGDRVTAGLIETCGVCKPCHLGHPNFCEGMGDTLSPGGFAEECLVRHSPGSISLVRIPDDMDDVRATLHEPLSCALRIVRRANPQPGDTVLVYGLGAMGILSGILFRKSYPIKALIGVDINPSRVKKAEHLGFDLVICADAPNFEESIREMSEPDVVVEATGIAAVFPRVINLVRLGGKVVIAGVPEDVVEFSPLPIFRKELTILGAKGPFPYLNSNGGSEALETLRMGGLSTHELVEAFPFDRAKEAFNAVFGGSVLKGVLTF